MTIKKFRCILALIIASVCIVLAGQCASYDLWLWESIFQSVGICSYVAWLFIIRDEK